MDRRLRFSMKSLPIIGGIIVWFIISTQAILPFLKDFFWNKSDAFVHYINLGLFMLGLLVAYIVYLNGQSSGSDDEEVKNRNDSFISVAMAGTIFFVVIYFFMYLLD